MNMKPKNELFYNKEKLKNRIFEIVKRMSDHKSAQNRKKATKHKETKR